jgi:sugar phosphate isomerase/epimerase
MSNRRAFLKSTLAAGGAAMLAKGEFAEAAAKKKRKPIPVGIEMYSVKDEEAKDILATLRALKDMGYEGVEFWAPYLEWTPEKLKDVRKQLDDLGMKAFSTHNRAHYFDEANFAKVTEYNQALGSKYVIMAQPNKPEGMDAWKAVADVLSSAHAKLKKHKMKAGFHNHGTEWKTVIDEKIRPIDVLARHTPKDFHFQCDTATCYAAGGDPIAFMKANPGRVKSFHLKDWSPDKDKGYKVLLGEGIGDWPKIIETAETIGGVEYYLIEQEGSRFSPMETAKRCLENFRKFRSDA